MGLISDGTQLLADLQSEAEGETVEYSRPGIFGPKEITAVLSVPEVIVDASTNQPARTESGRVDFLFRSLDFLAAMGIGFAPKSNDRIDRTIGTKRHRYLSYADSSAPAWEYGDPDNITIRVRTRLAVVL